MGVNTHCLLRYSMRDQIGEHAAIEARIIKAVEVNDGIFINNIVLSEFVWVLESNYKFSQAMVLNAINGLLEVQQFVFEKKENRSAGASRFQVKSRGFCRLPVGRKKYAGWLRDNINF